MSIKNPFEKKISPFSKGKMTNRNLSAGSISLLFFVYIFFQKPTGIRIQCLEFITIVKQDDYHHVGQEGTQQCFYAEFDPWIGKYDQVPCRVHQNTVCNHSQQIEYFHFYILRKRFVKHLAINQPWLIPHVCQQSCRYGCKQYAGHPPSFGKHD